MTTPLISAIVSTYNAELFIKGLLDDLQAQTIANQLEIIVIDSGSTQNEAEIVREYQKTYDNINYLRTERETVYAAWNRGIKMASGTFITNANTDDRRRNDAYQIMSDYLLEHPEIGLVYSDSIITLKPNETFSRNSAHGLFKFLEHDRAALIKGDCYIGPMPMWRRSIHEKAGYFDPDFVTSGDLEFWARASLSYEFKKIPQILGLYQKRDNSIENSNEIEKHIENKIIVYKYAPKRYLYLKDWSKEKIRQRLLDIEQCSKLLAQSKLGEAENIINSLIASIPTDTDALYLQATLYIRKERQQQKAIHLFEKILELEPNHSLALNNLAVWYWSNRNKKKAIQLMEHCVLADESNLNAKINLAEMYVQLNRTDKAIKTLVKITQQNLFHKEALEFLVKLLDKKDPVLQKYYADILAKRDDLIKKAL